jgi:GcrA cell cycle regulator
MSWTDERVETLKRMWAEGHSASAIAKELKDVTRNAVIGKVHRLGLSNRVGPGGEKAGEPERPAPEMERAVERAADRPTERAPERAPERPPERHAPAVEPEVEDAPEEMELASAPVEEEDEEGEPPAYGERVVTAPFRRAIVPAGQPLPPQPSANEISPEALAKVTEVEKSAKRLSLVELTERTCKWPVGDPATPNFWFCGLPVQAGKPYCEAHVGVAFQPMSARRDRRR